jgi:cyclophilin family peptidyl-prolyl cis-trans isomerase
MHRTIVCGAALLALVVGPAGASTGADSAAKAAEPMKAAAPAAKAPAAGAAAATRPAPTGAAHAGGGTATKMKTGLDVVVLETTVGDIVIRLADADAPKTAENFRKLVSTKFYDGTCFHRVIPGFMIQGGDPNSKDADPGNDGIGGPGYTVPAEIKLKHLRGSVATARQGDQVNPKRESSGSQFFIDLAPQPSLDAGGYTVFGEVIQGMDAVDKIAAMANDPSLPNAGGGGKNPGKKAMVKRAYLAPMAKFEKPATGVAKAEGKPEAAAKPEGMAKPEAAAKPEATPASKPASAPAPADTTHH